MSGIFVQIFEKCKVQGIDTKTDDFGIKRISSVQTNLGTIKTSHVINCTGVWAPDIARVSVITNPNPLYHQILG